MSKPKVSSSPDRHTFQKNNYLERCGETGEQPSEAYLEMWNQIKKDDQAWAESDDHKNDLEWDLRTSEWLVAKVRASEVYAQNVYAALCNMQWQRIDVWPVLKDETWSCSWRSAGGIVADLRGEGDYIDWYCSGIRGGMDLSEEAENERPELVSEGTVTDEVREDFAQLGWQPVPYNDD